MSLPNERHPGTTWFVTARTERREMRLKPTPEMTAAFAVAFCDAAERYGIEPTAVHVASNHYHAVLFDPLGRISDFLKDVHCLVARFGNAVENARVKFWDGQSSDVRELADAQAVVSRVAYVLANAVKDRLVQRLEDWPGLKTRVEDIGRWRGPVFWRPERFFRARGPVSEAVELCTYVPPMCQRAYGDEGFRRRIQREVDRLVAEAHAEAKSDGRGWVGVERIMRQSVWDAPQTPDGRGSGLKAKARGRVVASSARLLRAVLNRVAEFRRHYQMALARFAGGDREVEFPSGTWRAWRFFGVRRRTPEPGSLAAA